MIDGVLARVVYASIWQQRQQQQQRFIACGCSCGFVAAIDVSRAILEVHQSVVVLCPESQVACVCLLESCESVSLLGRGCVILVLY